MSTNLDSFADVRNPLLILQALLHVPDETTANDMTPFWGQSLCKVLCDNCQVETNRTKTFFKGFVHCPTSVLNGAIGDYINNQMISNIIVPEEECCYCNCDWFESEKVFTTKLPLYVIIAFDRGSQANPPLKLTLNSPHAESPSFASVDYQLIAKIIRRNNGNLSVIFQNESALFEYSESEHKGYAQLLMEHRKLEDYESDTIAAFYIRVTLLRDSFKLPSLIHEI